MQSDTGASVSLISEKTFQQLWFKKKAPYLKVSKTILRTYSGEQLPVLGELSVTVKYMCMRIKQWCCRCWWCKVQGQTFSAEIGCKKFGYSGSESVG